MRDRSDLQNLPRLLGTYPPGGGPAGTVGAKSEKLLILVGGLHGNEPAGVRAILRFFEELKESPLPIDGCVVGITGNVRALREGGRFLVHDLNRLWTEETVQLGPGLDGACGAPIGESVSGSEGNTEEVEQQEILRELRRLLDREPE
jgi:predicted deacylase